MGVWEEVAPGTYRLRVPGGWIYQVHRREPNGGEIVEMKVLFVAYHEKFVDGRWVEG